MHWQGRIMDYGCRRNITCENNVFFLNIFLETDPARIYLKHLNANYHRNDGVVVVVPSLNCNRPFCTVVSLAFAIWHVDSETTPVTHKRNKNIIDKCMLKQIISSKYNNMYVLNNILLSLYKTVGLILSFNLNINLRTPHTYYMDKQPFWQCECVSVRFITKFALYHIAVSIYPWGLCARVL